jgi:hypothetical protein
MIPMETFASILQPASILKMCLFIRALEHKSFEIFEYFVAVAVRFLVSDLCASTIDCYVWYCISGDDSSCLLVLGSKLLLELAIAFVAVLLFIQKLIQD